MTKNIDITKPITDRHGVAAKIIASGLTGPIPRINEPFYGGETLLVEYEGGRLEYLYADGRTSRSAVDPAIRNVAERTSEFRNFNSRGRGGVHRRMTLGSTHHSSLISARNVVFMGGEGVLEMIREGDKLVDVKFHAKA